MDHSNPDGTITIAGFGSLLSPKSARTTFPGLQRYRIAKVAGFRRIFAHVTPVFIEMGLGDTEKMDVGSLSAERCEGSEIVVGLFDIGKEALPAFHEREPEYEWIWVNAVEIGREEAPPQRALMCGMSTDDAFRKRIGEAEWKALTSKLGLSSIWREDVIPCRPYLRHCVLAATAISEEARDNFLDSTFTADRKTSIRQHLERNPGLLEEEPPASVGTRYNG